MELIICLIKRAFGNLLIVIRLSRATFIIELTDIVETSLGFPGPTAAASRPQSTMSPTIVRICCFALSLITSLECLEVESSRMQNTFLLSLCFRVASPTSIISMMLRCTRNIRLLILLPEVIIDREVGIGRCTSMS